jgi:hypothetical protein
VPRAILEKPAANPPWGRDGTMGTMKSIADMKAVKTYATSATASIEAMETSRGVVMTVMTIRNYLKPLVTQIRSTKFEFLNKFKIQIFKMAQAEPIEFKAISLF